MALNALPSSSASTKYVTTNLNVVVTEIQCGEGVIGTQNIANILTVLRGDVVTA